MNQRKHKEEHLANLLTDFIATGKLQSGINQVEVDKVWRSVLGKGVNSYTRKVTLQGETVYVELTSSVLREELHYGKQKIITLLNEGLGKDLVKEIVLR